MQHSGLEVLPGEAGGLLHPHDEVIDDLGETGRLLDGDEVEEDEEDGGVERGETR